MIFLKLEFDGGAAAGEATMEGYERQITLDTVRWELKATHKLLRATTLEPKDVRFTKVFDKASTVLYQRMDSWKPDSVKPMFDKATITMLDSTLPAEGSKRLPMMQMVLEKCRIDSISTSAAEAGKAVKLGESYVMSFATGSIEYFPRDAANQRKAAKKFVIPLKLKKQAA